MGENYWVHFELSLAGPPWSAIPVHHLGVNSKIRYNIPWFHVMHLVF